MFYLDDDEILYDENGGVIAKDGNQTYLEYLDWLAQGNTPEPWSPEAV